MMIPVFVVELDEADTAFGEATSGEAVTGEGAVAGLAAIEFEGFLAFDGEIHEFGDAGLHLKSHFVLSDAGGDFGIMDDGIVFAVE